MGVVAIGAEPIFDMLFEPYFLLASRRSGTNIFFTFLALAASNRVIESANWNSRIIMIACNRGIYLIFYLAAPVPRLAPSVFWDY